MNKEAKNLRQHSLTPPEIAAMIAESVRVDANEKIIIRRVILLQIIVTLVSAYIAFKMIETPQVLIATLSGGGISIFNAGLLAWRMDRSALKSLRNANLQLRLLYSYATERFLVVVVLLYFCIAAMKLSPLALLCGFAMAQLTMPVGRILLCGYKTGIATKNVK